MFNPNEDSFHAPNTNHNVNPTYIYSIYCVLKKRQKENFKAPNNEFKKQ